MRAAIYARYSSDLQRDASIEDQIRVCRERLEHEGWTLSATYTDHAKSGASALRPGYQKLLEDARRGEFEVLIAEALDRLSRDQEDIAGLYKHLSFAGVKILTLAEGEISELHVGLKGTMNALFLKDLAQKTHRGLEGRVRQGRSAGGISYGYDVIKEVDASGEPVHGGRRINEAQAVVVRRILEEFAVGKAPRGIARELNRDGILGPRGRPWSDTTIRGHFTRRTGILHNELYIGRLVWNKQRYVKDPRTGKRLARLNPENAWIVEDVPELRIVDRRLWDRVQRRLNAIRNSPAVQKAQASEFWTHRRPKHLLTERVKCGICGSNFTAVGKDYLACSAARRQGTCDNGRGIRRAVLEELILSALKDNLMRPELVKEFIVEFTKETNRHRHEIELEQEAKHKELANVTRRLNGLIDAIADGLRTPGLKARLDEMERCKAVLEQSLSTAPPPAPRLHPNLAELYRRKVENLHEALADPATRVEANDILRGLVERVVMRPIDKGFEVELVGEIANMVKLPADAGSFDHDPFRSSVKVVAGGGFEPPTFRL